MLKYAITLILFFVSLFVSLALSPEGIYQNSDILYLPSLALDLFRDKGDFLSWSFTPSPYFFPDFPIVSVLFLAFGNAQKALLTFALLQTILFTVLLEQFWIFQRAEKKRSSLSKKDSRRIKSWILLIVSALLLAAPEFPTLYILFLPSIHASAFLVTLYAWPLLHNKLNKRQSVFLFIWIVLTVASDRILVVELVVPGILAGFLFVKKETSDRGWKRFFPESSRILLVAGIAGLILHAILRSFLHIEKSGKISALVAFAQFQKDGIRFFAEARNWIGTGFRDGFPAPAILFLFLLIALLFSLVRIRKSKTTSFLFFFFAILTTAPIASGSYIDEYSLRYAAPALILAPFFLISIAGFPKRNLTLAIFLLFLLLWKIADKSPEGLENRLIRLAQWVPQESICLDEIAEKEPIGLAIADFWTSKKILVFSKKKIPALHVAYGTLEGSHTISNRDWYLKDYDGTVAVFKKGLEAPRILEVYGTPYSKENCGEVSVFLYRDLGKIRDALRRPFQKTK
ncbi:hypothetical protein [Leptospira adleri]|uniref:Glycosyltransferase RgtA/B/C/D-like domain-containing protein n=1 Tax=Leptospira adleri TaxID=2023186 RepID=A0A2M9YMX6_9LEPT|nr:hypothetical protein [Leptospira adleri]PJZ52903.1 hypothetical protein CH380_12635 [Leptospira adleri]PJZ62535.1 hypothetical protein CH376_07800 [Leptospira adleri]